MVPGIPFRYARGNHRQAPSPPGSIDILHRHRWNFKLAQHLLARCGLETTLATQGISLSQHGIRSRSAGTGAGRGGIGLSVDVLGKSAMEVRGETDVEVSVFFGEQDIDAIRERVGDFHILSTRDRGTGSPEFFAAHQPETTASVRFGATLKTR
jgi:hypothetical protein